jgi:hypothetical protein
MSKSRMAGDKLKDSSPDEHKDAGWNNYNNENYATDNQYGQDLSGIKYKEGISKHFGDDGSIGENDIKRMMDAGYSSDDVYNFSKKRGLNYNQHGQKYMKDQGDYQIGKGKDQWGDVFGSKAKVSEEPSSSNTNNGTDSIIERPPAVVTPNFRINSSQEQNISQDNDITTSIDGNNNVVNNNQDNSISQYGGNTTGFLAGWMDKYRFDKKIG